MGRGTMRIRHLSMLAGSLLALSACGDTPLTVRVTGAITDPYGQPIEDADVRISAGLGRGRTTTDADGVYSFKIDGFGTFALDVSAEGFASSRTTFSVVDAPDTDGSFTASAVRDVTLYPTEGSLSGRVIRSTGGTAPVADLPVRIQYYQGSVRDISLPTEAVTDGTGRYEFTGIPAGLNVRLIFPSIDEDEDGLPETSARVVTVYVNPNSATLYNTTLSQFESPTVVWTNVNNAVRQPDDALELFYNVPIDEDPARRLVRLRQISPQSFDVLATSEIDEGSLLRITPAEPMTEGGRYNLYVEAQSRTWQFIARSYNFDVQAASSTLPAPTDLRLADPDAEIGANQTTFFIRFALPTEADGFRIYNRVVGDVNTTDWVEALETSRVGGFTVDQSFTVPFALRPQGSPFAEGGTLEIAVTSRLDSIESERSNVISVQDGDCPRINFATGTVTGFDSWRNAGGTEANEVALRVGFSERMSLGGTPKLTIPTAGVNAGDFVWVWTSPFEGRFEGMVPAGTDVTDLVTVEARGMSDVSGNGMCPGGVDTVDVTVF